MESDGKGGLANMWEQNKWDLVPLEGNLLINSQTC